MKSIYLISYACISGPVNQALNIIYGLREFERIDMVLVTLSPELEGNSWLYKFKDSGIPHHCLNTHKIGIISAVMRLKKYLKENNIEVVHSSGFRANLVASFMPRKYRKIATQRCSPDDIGENMPRLLRPIITKMYLKTIDHIDCNVACSYTLQNIFSKKFKRKIGCVPNCVNTEYFMPLSDNDRALLRKNLGLDYSKKIFLILGRLCPLKNNITAIRTFNELKNLNAQLIVVGDGPEMDMLKSASENPNTLFIGTTLLPIKYLQASDALISCSLAEGLPNTVLEAISCGLPCILSDIEPHREIIGNTSAGVFFPTQDIVTLKDCIMEAMVWQEDRKIVARKLAVASFGISSLAKRYAQIYYQKN